MPIRYKTNKELSFGYSNTCRLTAAVFHRGEDRSLRAKIAWQARYIANYPFPIHEHYVKNGTLDGLNLNPKIMKATLQDLMRC